MKNKFLIPLVDKLDAETEHLAIREFLHLLEESPDYLSLIKQLTFKGKRFADKRINVAIEGIVFDNPIIVAAGWDKEARAVKALYDIGFSSIEVGTIPANPQLGNPQPRHFWLSPGITLNSYGFNSSGMDEVWKNIQKYKNYQIPIGISIGKNKEVTELDAPQAYASVSRKFYEIGSYFVINVSSPNTPGLRNLQNKDSLNNIVKDIIKVMEKLGGRKPLFVKISPDMSHKEIDDVIDVVLTNGLTGIVAANTTLRTDLKEKYGEQWRNVPGGLSGDDADFRKMVTECIKYIYRQTKGKIIIIGAGGIKDVDTAIEKIKTGATLIQIMSALDAEGPELPGKINRGIVKELNKLGLENVTQLVGLDAKDD